MNLIYLALLCGLLATSFIHKSEATLHAEDMVGGTAASVDQHTYVVSIQINDQHICGGGILHSRYIITAAHCFIDLHTNKFENEEFIVVAGVINAHNKHEQYREMREVAKIYIPREFNPTVDKFGDIAVLELNAGLGLNQFITNVVLPRKTWIQPTYENQQAVVCGYGDNWVTVRHDPHTNRVVEVCTGSHCRERKFAEVNILPKMACRNFYRNILLSQLCGHMRQRSPANPEGLCVGDSGSPLVIGNTIIGVVSASPKGCREDLEPALYTRVTSFRPFIINAINGFVAANMRLAKYEIERHNTKVLVEQ